MHFILSQIHVACVSVGASQGLAGERFSIWDPFQETRNQ